MEQTFEPTRLITPDAMPIPKVGNIGYVKFENPYEDIKVLKLDKHDIEPFTIEEVWKFINGVRKDYKNYYKILIHKIPPSYNKLTL